MSILELEYPPVLTPHLLNGLNGALNDPNRAALKSHLELTIEQCFRPFARYRGGQYAKRLNEAVQKYQPYRLWLAAKLFEMLGRDSLLKLAELVQAYAGVGLKEQWERLGLKPEAIADVLDRYGKSIRRLLASSVAASCWPTKPTQALQRLMDGLIWVASYLDFAVTSLCLMAEGELSAPLKIRRALAKAAREAVASYEVHVATLCREPMKLEEYFYQILRENGLWTASEEEDFPAAGDRTFRPIEMVGKPLSEMILEDRR